MENSCTRRIQFCSGHRVLNHESKCAHLHGHNYVVMVEAVAPLDSIGRVIDFSVLKERIGGWIDANWDHGMLLFAEDKAAIAAMRAFNEAQGKETKLYLLDRNPTAENMAAFLLEAVCPTVLEGTGVTVKSVRVWETENCYADAHL